MKLPHNKSEYNEQTACRITVVSRAGARQHGWLVAGPLRMRVALGRAGIRADKREGDGATPRGTFHPVRVWWRVDRGPRPTTTLPVGLITPDLAWCENPADRRYNRPFRRRDGEDGDRLARADHLYDLVVELDHNARPRVAGRGSAVFIHVARAGFAPTAGCIALDPRALRRLLAVLSRKTAIVVR